MHKFKVPVNLNSRSDMIQFLQTHFRYPTMNSWNRSESYACNLKIHKLGLGSQIEDKLLELLSFQEFFDSLQVLKDQFAEAHGYRWQVGMNGRSGGYLVLYEGERKTTGYRSFCQSCGQRNYTSIAQTGTICGRCGKAARVDYKRPPMQAVTYPGKGIDMDTDFEDWSMDQLRNRVILVQELDQLADDIVSEAVWFAQNYEIEEREVCIPQTQKVLVACL